jgi:hypothetical protein
MGVNVEGNTMSWKDAQKEIMGTAFDIGESYLIYTPTHKFVGTLKGLRGNSLIFTSTPPFDRKFGGYVELATGNVDDYEGESIVSELQITWARPFMPEDMK